MDVAVAGATGYVGSRLVPRLLDAGHDVRILARDPDDLPPWGDRVDVRVADLAQDLPDDLLQGIDAAHYLVHSVGEGNFQARDKALARRFAQAAKAAGVDHVVYLGGLLPDRRPASDHLESRAETGRTLAARVPTTELRAGPIIGPGSKSWDIVRHLTDRLPVMVAPKWIDNPVTPIATRDVVAYLTHALHDGPHGVVPIGAPDPVTFRDMMQTYAQIIGRRRWIFKVPFLLPRIAALWIGLVTPVPNRLAVPLVEGITQPVVADTSKARELWPDVEPMTYEEAVHVAVGEAEDPSAPR